MVRPRDVLQMGHSVLFPGLWEMQGGLGQSIQKVGGGTPGSVVGVLSPAALSPGAHSPAEACGSPRSPSTATGYCPTQPSSGTRLRPPPPTQDGFLPRFYPP